jgi:Hemerythrin HHE cation binding domain
MATHVHAPTPAPTPFLLEHAHADHEVAALRQAVAAKDAAATLTCLAALERALLQHFDAEETEMFGDYAAIDPVDVRRLNQEHAQLRNLLRAGHASAERGAFGVEQLHAIGIALTLHHAHEETGIYRWARENEKTAR